MEDELQVRWNHPEHRSCLSKRDWMSKDKTEEHPQNSQAVDAPSEINCRFAKTISPSPARTSSIIP